MEAEQRAALIERIRELTEPLYPLPANHSTKLRKLQGIRCVAFDFYGTMFISGVGDIGIDEDQKEESEKIFRESLAQAGLTVRDDTAGTIGLKILEKTLNRHITDAKARGIDYPEPEIRDVWIETLKELVNHSLVSGTIDESTAIKFAIEFEFQINAIWPVPNLADVLVELKELGLKLGIISNSQFYTPLAFEAILGKAPQAFGFDPALLVWSYATGHKKPDKHFYQQFVNRIHRKEISAGEVLYVGNDIRKDIHPAKNSGMHTALFVGDSRSIRHKEPELDNPSFAPDLVIDDLSQIKECLDLKP